MTEYDYSPEGYQRYMETQNRIARWIDNTEAHHRAFRVPFGPRSDVDEDDLDGMSEAEEAIPSGASAGGWYESKRRTGTRNISAHPPPPPLLYHPQPHAPRLAPPPAYPPALASAPVGYNYSSQAAYISPPASPPQPQVIIHSAPRHHSRSHHRSSRRTSSSGSKMKTYILPPPGSVGPPIPVPSAPSYGYPGAQPPPPPGMYTYPQTGLPYTSASPYATQPPYSPVGSPPVGSPSIISPTPSTAPPYYAQPGTSYVIMPKKGKHIRVTYV
jgi:hypothetical protein